MLPDKKYFQQYAKDNNIPFLTRNLLMEYLQVQTLKILSLSKFNDSISFLGGTSLRLIYKINRFSEDLDFDLIKKKDFQIEALESELKRGLENLGFEVDTKTKKTENIYIIFLKFKKVLKELGLTGLESEKLLIKFEIDYTPYKGVAFENSFVDSFNERYPVLTNTLSTIFAQKIIALKFRPYQKGRDFYDLVWFFAQKDLSVNYDLLKEKGLKVSNRQELKKELKTVISKLNLKQAAQDVERFLFYPKQADWVLDFEKYLASYCDYSNR